MSATADKRDVRVRSEKLNLGCKTMRFCDIVAVQPRDVVASRFLKADVSCCRDSFISFQADYPNARITKGLDDVATAVGRAIVDDNQLPIGASLSNNAFDCGRNISLAIVARDHHRNAGIGHQPSLATAIG